MMRLTTAFAVAVACLLPATSTRADSEYGDAGSCCEDDSCCDRGHGCSLLGGWYGGVGPIFLHRDRADKVVLGRMDAAGGSDFVSDTAELSTASLDFKYETGFMLTVGRHVDCCNSIEATYFQVSGFNDWSRGGAPGVDPTSPFPNVNATSTFGAAALQSAFYDSELRSLELNARSQVTDGASTIFGVRYMSVNEAFNFFSSRTQGVASVRGYGHYDVNTHNDLLGLQGGGELSRAVGNNFAVGATAKAGVFLNFVEQKSHLLNVTENGANNADVGGGTDTVSWATVVDLSVHGTMYLSDRLSVRGGYMLLFVNGLALAPEQLDWQPTTTWASQINDNGNITYDGAFFMVEWNR